MSSSIPTSTSVTESAVIEAPLSQVWHLIKLQDFSKFWSKLEKSETIKGLSPETDVVKWTFKDGTELDVKQEEHSVCLKNSTACYIEREQLQMYISCSYGIFDVLFAMEIVPKPLLAYILVMLIKP